MNKYIFVLLVSISSLYCAATYARDCSGRIYVNTDASDPGYIHSKYTPNEENRTLLAENITIAAEGMSCSPDGMDGVYPTSNIQIKLANGASCSSNNTVPSGIPGINWQLEGMSCQGSYITSNTSVRGNMGDYSGKINWNAGTSLGKIKLIVTDNFWRNAQEGNFQININQLVLGNSVLGSPAVNIDHVFSVNPIPFNIENNGTCGFSLSTTNLDFGKLSLDEINSENVFQQFNLNYYCDKNWALNGIKLRFDPEQVVDAANGIFSATDANGRKLNFRLAVWEERYGIESAIRLNNDNLIYQANPDYSASSTAIRVRVLKSTPFPAGKVSTYINISLVYM